MRIPLATAALLFLYGCGGGGGGGLAPPVSGNAVIQWDQAALQAVRSTKPGPPMVARMMAIVHTCAFDAWAAYDPIAVGTRLGGTLRRPASERTLANKNKAISFASYRALVDLFPSQVAYFNTVMVNLGYDPATRAKPTSTAPRRLR